MPGVIGGFWDQMGVAWSQLAAPETVASAQAPEAAGSR